jgi:hypothetical protein
VVPHVGSKLLLAGRRELGFCDLAAQHRGGEVPGASLRAAIDAVAISLALGEESVECRAGNSSRGRRCAGRVERLKFRSRC